MKKLSCAVLVRDLQKTLLADGMLIPQMER
jgi:hypothetical protein